MARIWAPVAQGIEQRFPKPCVGGSIPPGRTKLSQRPLWMDDEQLMRLALEQAEVAASVGEVPVGAVLMSSSGLVIARNYNRR